MLSYQLVTPPAVEPVSLQLAKSHLRVEDTFTLDDTLISAYVTAARQYAEQYTNRAFFDQTWVLSLDHFPLALAHSTINPGTRKEWLFTGFWNDQTIYVPKPTLVSVTSITYVDSDNVVQTLDPSTYTVDRTSEPARIVPAPGQYWPFVQSYIPGSVRVTYVAGSYGDGSTANLCPQTIVLAILLLVHHWYENRGASTEQNLKSTPNGVESLLDIVKFTCLSYGRT